MIGKAFNYFLLSILLFLLSPIHAFCVGLEWDCSWKGFWKSIGRIFYDRELDLQAFLHLKNDEDEREEKQS